LSCASSFSLFSVEVPISLPRYSLVNSIIPQGVSSASLREEGISSPASAGALIFEHQGSDRAKPNRIKRR